MDNFLFTDMYKYITIRKLLMIKIILMFSAILCIRIQASPSSADEIFPVIVPQNTTQTTTITGTVIDEFGDPMPGVHVVVKGITIGTSTKSDGQYSINVPDKEAILVFSYIGYITQELKTGNQTVINITMGEDLQQMEEVVVIGYGTQKKVNLTGSVDAISGDELQNRAAVNMGELVKGASPNLNITMGMRGGEPGATSSWNIRGMGSINADAAPLILVDGVEVNINNIDPESIESISILKDASASAIYGSRAPFGVILITTKKGKTGKVSVGYSNNLSMNVPMRISSFVDAMSWVTAYNQANANAGLAPLYSDEQVDRVRRYMEGTFPYEYDPEKPVDNIWAGRRVGNANNNWPKLLIADHSFNQKHHINLSGGSEKTNYYIAGGFVTQDGIYRYGNDNYKRFNLLSNLNSQVTKWLNVKTGIKYAKGLSDYPVGQTTVGREHMMGEMLTFAPLMPMYNINGTIQCPLVRWQQDSGRDKWESNDFFANLGADIEPIKGWVTSFSYNHNVINTRRFTHPKPVWVELGTGQFGNVGKPESSWEAVYTQTNYSLLNVVSSYETTLGNHYLNALAGYEQEEKKYTSLTGKGVGLITDEVPSIKTSLGEKTVTDAMNHWATQGIFGRINYNYKEKYLIEVSARYNGSSRFSPDTRWGFFPSASVGYVISKEEFWESLQSAINILKIRGSYGSLGNQNVGLYSYLSTMGVGSELNWIIDGTRPQYVTPPGLISHDLTWEKITTANIGFDAGFLNNRLQVTFDWFERITKDMLGPTETLPYPLGASAPQRNNAELSTKGFELVLSWRDRISSDFSYNAKISIGDHRAKILKYYNDKELIDTWYPGKEVGEIWGYTTDGIIQAEGEAMPDQSKFYATWGPGDIKYKDLNGDGKINDGTRTLNDHGDLKVIGNTTPRYNYSISAGFNWKGLDFNMFWQGVGKRDYFPPNTMQVFWGMLSGYASSGLYENSRTMDYWRPADETNMLGPNTNAYFAKPYFSAQTNKNRQVQTRYLQNAAYLRLKNLQIGYTLPTRISEKVFLQRARVYLSGENLLTITGLPDNFDPETTIASDPANDGYQAGRIYPLSKVFSVGVNLTF
ncbi:MAG: TonB-dependent receptor [Tannerella sp.]|jgi:TonB-linked SusC/RagA family outer membrane protein|nr:TonB-dependent receptor [Tannerella sp.]